MPQPSLLSIRCQHGKTQDWGSISYITYTPVAFRDLPFTSRRQTGEDGDKGSQLIETTQRGISDRRKGKERGDGCEWLERFRVEISLQLLVSWMNRLYDLVFQ